jgi:DNA ligase-1
MKQMHQLYKQDSTGRIRVWWLEYDQEKYRSHSGLIDGKHVTSGWQFPIEKNIGKANGTSVEEQVLSEVKSRYTIQQYQGKYAPTIEEAKKGAKFIECMLACKYDEKKHQEFPYWSQPKLDGIRCLVSEDGLQSRNGKPLLSSPHIREVLQPIFDEFPDVILDGELYNHSLKHDFEKIISLARKTKPKKEDIEESKSKVEYHIYDVITTDPMIYAERMKFIQTHIGTKFPMVRVVPTVLLSSQEEIEQKLSVYLEDGYEGQMLRDTKSPYEHKRAASLIKHKTFEDAEFEIVNVIEGKGNYIGYAKSLEIKLESGETQQCGMRGDFAYLKEVLDNKESYIGTEATVVFQNRTADGKLRFPISHLLWKGKRDV